MAGNSMVFPIGNIYAPPFYCVSPQVAGVRDQEFDISFPDPITVDQDSFSNGNELALDADYDFLVREIQFVVNSDESIEPSAIRVRIRDANGRLFTTDFVYIQDLNGPLALPWALRKGGVLTFDFQYFDVAGENSVDVQVVLKGWKRQNCPGEPAIPTSYIPMWRRYSVPRDVDLDDYEYPFTFTSAGAGDILRVPLQTDNDADFLWRGVAGDWDNPNNDVVVVGLTAIVFYDPTQTPMIQTPLTVPWGSLVAGEATECAISLAPGAPAPIFPEVFIPRGGVALVDISFGAAATVRFSLRGLKQYTPEICT